MKAPVDSGVEVIVLGCGTSHGVPMIGCDCSVCTSTHPCDKRTRCSIFVRSGLLRILIDTAPELRLQCTAHGIDAVDAVLYTHHHADHILGLDDLRRFNWLMKKHMPCYGTDRTLAMLRQMFGYAFSPAPDSPHSRPLLTLHSIDAAPFRINGSREIVPIPLMHGPLPVLGFRFGRMAYCTDCNSIPPSSLELLRGLDVLILDALRHQPHPAHFNLEQAVGMARKIGANQTYFTHTTHDLGYEETNAGLPDGVRLAFDGLRIDVPTG